MPANTMRVVLFLTAVSAAPAQTAAKGVNFFSIEKEIELGKQLASVAQTSLQAQPDARLQAIGDKLAAKTDGTFQYHFFVYTSVSPQSEAVALPGGPVFVAQDMLAAGDGETAAILAHAIAHIVLRHYTRAMTRGDLMEIGMKQAAPGLATNESVRQAMEMGMAESKQKFEFDADQLAVKLMMDAGYDPNALVRWMESLPVPKINLALGDRPAPTRRVAAIRQAIQAAQ